VSKVRFLLDEHVAYAVAEALRRRGIDVATATDAGLLGAPDEAYLAYASETERVVVTSDSDCLRLHRELPHAGIAFSEQSGRTVGQLVAGLVLIYEALEASEMAGRVEFL
jgi:predicted nuclease of predicted toxin-antitoxin system